MILPSAPLANPPPVVPQEIMASQRQSWTLPFSRTIFTILSISASLSTIVSVLATVNVFVYHAYTTLICAGLTALTVFHHLTVYRIVRRSSDATLKPPITRSLLTKSHIWPLCLLMSFWLLGAIVILVLGVVLRGLTMLLLVNVVFMILEVMVLLHLCVICIRGRRRFTKSGSNGPGSTSSADASGPPSFSHDPPPAYDSAARGEELYRSMEKQLEDYEQSKLASDVDSFSAVKFPEPRMFD